jgi:predicted DNA-binding transcriptional regulator AlpA
MSLAGQSFLNARQVCEKLQISHETFRRWLMRTDAERPLPAPVVMPSGRRRWLEKDLDAWIEGRNRE